MSKYKVDDTQLAAIADAIRTKTSSSDLLEFPDEFVSKVGSIAAEVSSGNRTISVPLNIMRLSAYEAVYTGVNLGGGGSSPVGNIHRWTVTGAPPTWFDSIEFYVLYDSPSDKWQIYIRNKTNMQLTNLYKTVSVTYKVFTAQIK